MPVDNANISPTTTIILTNAVLTLRWQDGVNRISVKNASAVAGSYEGTGKIQGLGGDPLPLAEGDSVSVIASENKVLDGDIITAPAGCTLEILCNGNNG